MARTDSMPIGSTRNCSTRCLIGQGLGVARPRLAGRTSPGPMGQVLHGGSRRDDHRHAQSRAAPTSNAIPRTGPSSSSSTAEPDDATAWLNPSWTRWRSGRAFGPASRTVPDGAPREPTLLPGRLHPPLEPGGGPRRGPSRRHGRCWTSRRPLPRTARTAARRSAQGVDGAPHCIVWTYPRHGISRLPDRVRRWTTSPRPTSVNSERYPYRLLAQHATSPRVSCTATPRASLSLFVADLIEPRSSPSRAWSRRPARWPLSHQFLREPGLRAGRALPATSYTGQCSPTTALASLEAESGEGRSGAGADARSSEPRLQRARLEHRLTKVEPTHGPTARFERHRTGPSKRPPCRTRGTTRDHDQLGGADLERLPRRAGEESRISLSRLKTLGGLDALRVRSAEPRDDLAKTRLGAFHLDPAPSRQMPLT